MMLKAITHSRISSAPPTEFRKIAYLLSFFMTKFLGLIGYARSPRMMTLVANSGKPMTDKK